MSVHSICPCPDAAHAIPGCPERVRTAARAVLYAGLYDGPPTPERGRAPIRLLDPSYGGDDPAARRFALIEIA